jgi:hypothetical protein
VVGLTTDQEVRVKVEILKEVDFSMKSILSANLFHKKRKREE